MAIIHTYNAIRHLIEVVIGEDADRSGLQETPKRLHEALQFWTSGYAQLPGDVLKTFDDGAEGYDEMVLQASIPIYSLCEHHMAPFFGVAHIGYIPNGKVVGLSKLARLADIFARRLQVQERLTVQIGEALMLHLAPIGAGVVLQCRHMCMESRGVCKQGTVTTTSALFGVIKNGPARNEFLNFVNANTGHV